MAQLADTQAQRGALSETDPTEALLSADAAEAAVQERGRALEAAQAALAQLHQDYAEASAEAQARTQAAARQRAAFEARRGYAQGPKSALTSRIAGVVGSVADLITVPPEYAQAVSSALGRRAEHVVVASSGGGAGGLGACAARGWLGHAATARADRGSVAASEPCAWRLKRV